MKYWEITLVLWQCTSVRVSHNHPLLSLKVVSCQNVGENRKTLQVSLVGMKGLTKFPLEDACCIIVVFETVVKMYMLFVKIFCKFY